MKRLTITIMLALVANAHGQAVNVQADALFHQGRDLMAQQKFGEACTAFEASEKLDPAITTILNLADCREKNGQLATAWSVFLDAERRTTDAASSKLHAVASDHAAKLELRLSKLQITVSSPVPGEVITKNKEAFDSAIWGRMLPSDGGTYEIVATAPNHEPWSTTVTLAVEADSKVVEVPPLPETKASTATPPPVVSKRVPAPTPPSSSTHGRYPRLSLGLTAGGGAIVIAGLVVGELAISKWNSAQSVCGSSLECDNGADLARAHSLGHSAYVRGNIATGLIAGGAAISVAGVLMLALVRDHEGVTVTPEADSSSVGVGVHASF